MAAEPEQSSLSELNDRQFAFYPAIRGIEHNEWRLERETWSEVLVRNLTTDQELWIPRNHIGEVSSTDSPVLILGLERELEYKAGSVMPYRKVVLQMPSQAAVRERDIEEPPPPPPSDLTSGTDAKTFRLLGIALSIGLTVALIGFMVIAGGFRNPFEYFGRPDTTTADQRYLSLAAADSYHDVVSKMGSPEKEEWVSRDDEELQFQALHYNSRGYVVVMMGGSRSDMRYIGTVHDPSRRMLDSAQLAGGGDTSSMMKNLPEF